MDKSTIKSNYNQFSKNIQNLEVQIHDQIVNHRKSKTSEKNFYQVSQKVFVYVLTYLLVNEHFFGTPCIFIKFHELFIIAPQFLLMS